MSTEISNRKVFRLSEVTDSVRKTLQKRYTSSFWVTAEINKLNHYSHSGHCYPELVEKEGGKIRAEIRSVLWKEDFNRINETFKKILDRPLTDGIRVLMLVKISFHAISGIQLHVLDIDPTFTLGDLEREKNETVARLRNENIFSLNKTRPLALVPKRIAVISAETSKGYRDFAKILDSNPWNYRFFYMLFPAFLQGDKSVISIVARLEQLKKVQHHFDVVAIIRGGGGDVGLSSFNNYELARAIAGFPLPVITGIGHATNDTVAEMVSYYNAITPTQSAEFLIQKFHNFSIPVQEAQKTMLRYCEGFWTMQRENLARAGSLLKSKTLSTVKENSQSLNFMQRQVVHSTQYQIRQNDDALKNIQQRISTAAKQQILRQSALINQAAEKLKTSNEKLVADKTLSLNHLEINLRMLDPRNVLQRGYSITKFNGKVLTSNQEVTVSDEIETLLFQGTIRSKVTQKI